jgi:hypothetical protein
MSRSFEGLYQFWLSGFCPHCSLDFITAEARNHHLWQRDIRVAWKFPCQHCPAEQLLFDTDLDLMVHLHHFHLQEPVGDFSVHNWTRSVTATKKTPQPPVKVDCELCHETFATKVARYHHRCQAHSKTSKGLYSRSPCLMCPKILSSPSSLQRHNTNKHDAKHWRCFKCWKEHSSRAPLIEHWAFCQPK